ncbi:metallophosphoesterase family protein [Streptomyces boncukensis]|uniref:Metallophosphoesterase family protein n=1 Tax=Streptomyces boncukensis TaxID=2711219 RepID=A0A6G4WSM4_9ACTN|nr:metallophosphoesterase family protein [Streptomyces boncukensis]NGO67481.1 metallophosphoesterase family protein [Streptomyces boncukensis]
MHERVAVLSDVHAVLPALEAVLAEPDVAAADRVVLTGDLAAGPQPAQVLDLLAGLGRRAVWLSGNADRELVEYRRGERDTIPDPIGPWAAGQLRADHLDLLARLPERVTLPVRGLGTVLFCHATPRDDEEIVLVDSRPERWREALAGVPEAVRTVVCGHTHMPFVRLADGRTVVNPGSVGMPYGGGSGAAHWALLGPGVALRRTAFDAGEAVRRVARDSAYPGAAEWAETYLGTPPGDAEALDALHTAAGDGSA